MNRARGRAEAEAQMAALVDALLAQGRTDDLRRAAADPAARRQLYRELGIEAAPADVAGS
jgi:alpha-D-ribose 1-methylphosphonate 5-triphosphate synthase subunit PhnG